MSTSPPGRRSIRVSRRTSSRGTTPLESTGSFRTVDCYSRNHSDVSTIGEVPGRELARRLLGGLIPLLNRAGGAWREQKREILHPRRVVCGNDVLVAPGGDAFAHRVSELRDVHKQVGRRVLAREFSVALHWLLEIVVGHARR